jgi:hypothetical protein
LTSTENTVLVDESTMVAGVMSRQGKGWCQWSDFGFPLPAISF